MQAKDAVIKESSFLITYSSRKELGPTCYYNFHIGLLMRFQWADLQNEQLIREAQCQIDLSTNHGNFIWGYVMPIQGNFFIIKLSYTS